MTTLFCCDKVKCNVKYRYNAIMLDADDFLSCFKILDINIFDNLAFSVHVTVFIFKCLFGKKNLKSLPRSIHKEMREIEKQIQKRKETTNSSDNTDL
jgi:hypothetical protein